MTADQGLDATGSLTDLEGPAATSRHAQGRQADFGYVICTSRQGFTVDDEQAVRRYLDRHRRLGDTYAALREVRSRVARGQPYEDALDLDGFRARYLH